MACNSNDCRQRRKQGVAVGAAASEMRVPSKARSRCWVPQPELVSEEKAPVHVPVHAGEVAIRQLLGRYGLRTVERLCALCAALHPQNAPACALAAQRARQLEADGVCCRVSQLDYFAVVPAYRAHGIGAQLLAQLPAQEGDAEAILIEAEMPEKAEDAAMAVRRLGFYARCGAQDVGWTEHLIDARFRVLVLPCGTVEGLPMGMQLIGRKFSEELLYNVAYSFEQATGLGWTCPKL